MSCGNYFAKSHRLLVISPFWANNGTVYVPKGTSGRVVEGQNLYGYVTVEFRLGKCRIQLLRFLRRLIIDF